MSVQEPAKAQLWGGRIASGIAVLGLLASAAMKLTRAPEVVDMLSNKLGFPESKIPVLAAIEIACALLYAFPKTALVGAVLATGYLGGAVAIHLRVGDSVASPIITGVIVWLGLWLRDLRLRQLAPLRS